MRKVFCAAFSAALIALILCSCNGGGNTAEQTTVVTTGETPGTSQAASVPETTTWETTIVPSTADESTAVQTTSAPEPTTGSPADTTPSTVAEIVACFNEAANKIKQERPGYRFSVKSATDREQINIDTEIPFKYFITRFIASGINKETKSTVNRGDSHNDFPVKGQAISSKLQADAVQSASCMQTGGFYVIELHFKDEKLNSLPEKPFGCRHGNAFSLILASDFTDSFGGIDIDMPGFNIKVENKKFSPTYTGSIITCSISVSGMRMTQAKYFLNTLCYIETQIDVNKKIYPMNITFEYSVTESYVFT